MRTQLNRHRLAPVALVGVALGLAGPLLGRGDDGSKPTAASADSPTAPTRPALRHRSSLAEVVRSEANNDVAGATAPAESPGAAHRPARAAATWTSATIDDLINHQLAATKGAPAPAASDEAFLRRLSLDVTGKPPEIAAIRRFVAARTPGKRAAMVDTLLADPDFGRNWARYWRDVVAFRAPDENQRNLDFPEFVDWLAGEFHKNTPWNTIATRIITATGRTDENGATVFALAEDADPVELAGEVSRVFLGIQIQCAQCHDHPSDPWKRQQFHEFAAFFAGVKRTRAQKAEAGMKAIFAINDNGPARYSMTDLKDPEKKIPITPRFFLGEARAMGEQMGAAARLKAAAEYVTGPTNPWFARAFVNRIWTTLMGEGFYDLVDDLGPTRTPAPGASEILDGLADQWRDHDCDVRWLFAAILKTEAYGRESRSTNSAAGRTRFASNAPSRLRADQIFDVMDQAFNLDQAPAGRAAVKTMTTGATKAAGKGAKAEAAMRGEDGENAVEAATRRAVDHTFGVDPSTPAGDVVGTIPQALYMMNSPLVTRSVQARPGTMLGKLLDGASSPREAIEALYLKTLARRPNPRELAVCLKHLDSSASPREGYEDILWSLVNSTEFISRR